MYKIVRVLNHNTVIATLDDDKEVSKVKISSEDENAYLLMGKGIGFGKKSGQEAELKEAYEQETERAEEIESLADYVQSDQYIIDMAHSKLGLAYDNEIIFKESK